MECEESEGGPPSSGEQQERLPPFTLRQMVIITLMSLMAMSTFITFAVIAPFYPGEAYNKGMSVSEVGLVFAIYFVGVFTGSLVFGNFMTAIGSRFMYIAGMFVRGVSDIIFGFLIYAPSGTPFLALCFVVRLFESFGAAAFMTSVMAIVAREFPGRVASLNGWIWACNAMGIMLGPPVGGFLYDLGGFTFPFIILGGIMLVVTVISIFLMPDVNEKPDANSSEKRQKRWIFSLLWNPSIVINFLCAILMYGPICFVEISLESLLEPFNLSAGFVGLVFTCEMAAYACFSVIVGHINNRRFYPRFQQVAGCVLYGVSYLCLAPSPLLPYEPRIWSICVCLVGIGLAASSINSAGLKDNFDQATVVDGYPYNMDTHGLVSGLYLCSTTVGAFLGTYMGSALAEVYGFPVASTVYAVIMWAVAGVVAVYKVFEARIQAHRKRRRHRQQQAAAHSGAAGHSEYTPLIQKRDEDRNSSSTSSSV